MRAPVNKRPPNVSGTRKRLLGELAGFAADSASGRDAVPVETPLTGEVIGEVPGHAPEDVRRAASKAEEAQRTWREASVRERSRILLRFHDLVLDRQSEVLDLIQLETGKARLLLSWKLSRYRLPPIAV